MDYQYKNLSITLSIQNLAISNDKVIKISTWCPRKCARIHDSKCGNSIHACIRDFA